MQMFLFYLNNMCLYEYKLFGDFTASTVKKKKNKMIKTVKKPQILESVDETS